MPRDGSGVYSRPPGTDGVPDTSIESTKYNGNVADVETDLNTPRPIIAGGTGSNTVTGARDNLDAEVARALVTNFDTHVFENGSFTYQASTTAAPTANPGVGFALVHANPDYAALTVRDVFIIGSTRTYTRNKYNGVWSAWVAIDPDDLVHVTGDTMTGNLTINKDGAALLLNNNGGVAASTASIQGLKNSKTRWGVRLGNGDAETGGNFGNNFDILRFDDAGNYLAIVASLNRSNGNAVFQNNVMVGNGAGNGTVHFTNSPGANYLVFDGTAFYFAGGGLNINTGPLQVLGGDIHAFRSVIGRFALGSYYNLDGTLNTVSAASGAVVAIISNFSGLILTTAHTMGGTDLWLCGAGSAVKVSGPNHSNVVVAAPQSGYVIYNATGGTSTFGVIVLRTRQSH